MLVAGLLLSLFPASVQAQGSNDYAPTNSAQGDSTPPVPPPTPGQPSNMNGGGPGGPGGGPWGGGGGRFRRGGFGGGAGLGGGQGFGGPGGGAGGLGGEIKEKLRQRFDANGDGKLDDNEMAKLRAWQEQREQRRAQGGQPGGAGGPGAGALGGGPGGGGFGGPGGPGGPGGGGRFGGGGGDRQARMQEFRDKMLKRFDTDGDGKLNDQEQAAADAFRQQRRAERMQRMKQGGFGGGAQAPGANQPPGNGAD